MRKGTHSIFNNLSNMSSRKDVQVLILRKITLVRNDFFSLFYAYINKRGIQY